MSAPTARETLRAMRASLDAEGRRDEELVLWLHGRGHRVLADADQRVEERMEREGAPGMPAPRPWTRVRVIPRSEIE